MVAGVYLILKGK